MMTIDTTQLATVAGGYARGQSPDQIRERRRNLCYGKDVQAQYQTMLKQMVPDNSEAPGIKRRAVKSIAQLCGWPFPK